MGIPEAIAKDVVKNITVQQNKVIRAEATTKIRLEVIILGVGIAGSVGSYLLLSDRIIVPLGLLATSIVGAIIAKQQRDSAGKGKP